VPAFDAESIRPGMVIVGAAVVTSPFTTLVLRPGDRCQMTSEGGFLVAVEPEEGTTSEQ